MMRFRLTLNCTVAGCDREAPLGFTVCREHWTAIRAEAGSFVWMDEMPGDTDDEKLANALVR